MDEVKISKKLTTEVEHKSEHYDYVQNRIHLNEYLRDNQKQEDNLYDEIYF